LARALVTGCAGFIGSHLTESLLADGHAVTGIDCFNDNYRRADKRANLARALDHDAFHLVCDDVVDTDLRALLEGCDVVYHLAGEPGVRSSWGARFDRYTHHNVAATQRLLEAARAVPGRRIVYASSSSIYGDALALPTREDAKPQPLSPYGVTKLAAEQMCALYRAEHGVDTVALRYFSVYARASGRTWPSGASATRSWRAGPSTCSATAARPATSPTWRTSSPPPARRARATPAARSTWAAARRSASTGRSSCSPGSPAVRWTSAAATASPATCATPARTSPVPGGGSGGRPRRPSRTGWRTSSPGRSARLEQRLLAGEPRRPVLQQEPWV
jgi:NAD(P)-dependent dehydrogenase (short-subunit alcohol dehydrogenase family)